uniref:Uncharacterized protein n=1 Tax=Romanomermis culicivorax TaxID=13658 RepID=A0A915KS86_ROMCU
MLLLSALIWRLFGRLGIQMTTGENENDEKEGTTILDDNTFTLSEFRFLFDDILQSCRIYLHEYLNCCEKGATNSNFVILAIFSVLKNICITKDDWKFCDGEDDR